MEKAKIYNPTITVCSRCKRAACWQGEFMCDDAVEASTFERKVSTLIKGKYGEHPDWWNQDLFVKNEPLLTKENLMVLGENDKQHLELSQPKG